MPGIRGVVRRQAVSARNKKPQIWGWGSGFTDVSCAKSGVGPSFLPEEMNRHRITAIPDYCEKTNRHRITPEKTNRHRITPAGLLLFIQGRFAESAEDCQRVLKLNPYHVGAISGLAQCQMLLNQPHEALRTLRRAAKLQPHNPSIRENIQVLEAQIESNGTR